MIAKPTSPFHVHAHRHNNSNPPPPPSPCSFTPHSHPAPRIHHHHHHKPLSPLRPNSPNPPPPVSVSVRFSRTQQRHRCALHDRAITFTLCMLIWLSIRTLILHDLRPLRAHRLHHDHSHGGGILANDLNTSNSYVSLKQQIKQQQNDLPRRVFSTASLLAEYDGIDERKPRFPGSFAWPPEFGKRRDLAVLDVGANVGDMYTLLGWTHGHSVLAFDASPSVQQRFQKTMQGHGVRFMEATVVPSEGNSSSNSSSSSNGPQYKVRLMESVDHGKELAANGSNVGGKRKEAQHRVVFVPYGLANKTGSVVFFDKDDCGGTVNKCARMNQIVYASAPSPSFSKGHKNNGQQQQQRDLSAPKHGKPYLRIVEVFRFDDLLFDTTSTSTPTFTTNKNAGTTTMIDPSSIWFVRISVTGHEAEVLHGMRHFLALKTVQYVSIEFSPPSRASGIDLLEQLRNSGFACYHARGFGKCHDSSVRSSSRACNFPFVGGAESEEDRPSGDELRALAPTFEQYVDVFVGDGGKEQEQDDDRNRQGGQRMADLMCRREEEA